PIIPSHQDLQLNFKIKGKIQKALHFFLQPQKNVSIEEYYHWIGKQCANEIHYWITLARTGEATITTKSGKKVLTENDIIILV
ncbi:MAG: hypothetical protein O4M80_05390, partial [Buchnera aphidicola]|nr:hypothetical protein [Buchnera aphidicola]